jgi:hypothetical protein
MRNDVAGRTEWSWIWNLDSFLKKYLSLLNAKRIFHRSHVRSISSSLRKTYHNAKTGRTMLAKAPKKSKEVKEKKQPSLRTW